MAGQWAVISNCEDSNLSHCKFQECNENKCITSQHPYINCLKRWLLNFKTDWEINLNIRNSRHSVLKWNGLSWFPPYSRRMSYLRKSLDTNTLLFETVLKFWSINTMWFQERLELVLSKVLSRMLPRIVKHTFMAFTTNSTYEPSHMKYIIWLV